MTEIHPDLLESYKALAKEDSAKRARLGARLDVEIQLRERQHAAILHQISCEERVRSLSYCDL